MAFFDKIGEIAKNVGDKTSEVIEVNKLNSKINGEETVISSLKTQMGEFYWNQYAAGEQLAPEAMECCTAIQASLDKIEAIRAEIQNIKIAKEIPLSEVPPQPSGKEMICPSCQTVCPENTKFCKECGSKLEQPEEPAVEVGVVCTSCQTVNENGTKFCKECGTQL